MGTDGLLHKVKDGADSVLPFSSKCNVYVYKLVNYPRTSLKSINISIQDVYPDYENLTINNIIVQIDKQGAGTMESTSTANYTYECSGGTISITSSQNRFGSETTSLTIFIIPNINRITLS